MIGGVVSPVHDAYAKKGLVAAQHRAAMVKLALQSSKWVRLSDWECADQLQWTKTRQVLQYHQVSEHMALSKLIRFLMNICFCVRQNYLNSYLHDTNGTSTPAIIPSWMPDDIRACRGNGAVQLKLLCGADLLESFAVPGLWREADVSKTIILITPYIILLSLYSYRLNR